MQLDKNHITGIILAGGKSSRMGQEKGMVLLNQIPFIQHIINQLKKITDNIQIISNTKDYKEFGYPCISDIFPDCGPVGGIYTGLKHSTTRKNLILSCDIPFITSTVLELLIYNHTHNFQVTQCKVETKTMPLVAIYDNSCLNVFHSHILEKKLKLQQVLQQLTVNTVNLDKSMQNAVHNINTMRELQNSSLWN